MYGWNTGDAIWHGEKLDFWKNKYQNKIHLKDLIIDFIKVDNTISYPIAACFVRFLIDNFGISKFKQLYKKLNFEQLNIKFWK